MIWLSWRLHRAAVLTFIAVIGGLAALYIVDAIRLHDVYTASGLHQCVGVLNDPSCAARRQVFLAYDVGWLQYTGYVVVAACGALGAFLGAPMVGTEFERGTWQWIWTQRISRTRWLAVNVAVVAVIVAAFGAALGAAYTWWNQPVAAQTGPFTYAGSFDNTPLMCAVYSVFAFALGVAASAFLRRILAAMGATAAVFLAVRFAVVSPRTRPEDPLPSTCETGTSAAHGSMPPATRFPPRTLQQNNIHYYDLIQPYQRAGTFQLIEAGVFLGLVAICLALAFWRIRRRTA